MSSGGRWTTQRICRNFNCRRELLGKTRFGNRVFIYWFFRNSEKFYFDISRFPDSAQNYDVHALLCGWVRTVVFKWGRLNGLVYPGFTDLIELARGRISEFDYRKQSESLNHITALDIAAYGERLLHPAFRRR